MIGRALAMAAVLAVIATLAPAHASGDARPSPAALARLCVSEAGWDTKVGDCPALYAAIANRAEDLGLSWMAMARAYASRVYDRERTGPRRWISWLSPTLERPRGWPDQALAWERGAALWRARLVEARLILAGELVHGCDGRPSHWGGRHVDRERIQRGVARGYWRILECSPATLNTFLEVRRSR